MDRVYKAPGSDVPAPLINAPVKSDFYAYLALFAERILKLKGDGGDNIIYTVPTGWVFFLTSMQIELVDPTLAQSGRCNVFLMPTNYPIRSAKLTDQLNYFQVNDAFPIPLRLVGDEYLYFNESGGSANFSISIRIMGYLIPSPLLNSFS